MAQGKTQRICNELTELIKKIQEKEDKKGNYKPCSFGEASFILYQRIMKAGGLRE